MSAFEHLTGKLSNLTLTGIAKARILADVSVSKAKDVTEIAKLKVEIATEEDAIRKAYQEIGKLYFAERSQSPEGPYAVLCEKITAAKETIAYHEERISDIKVSFAPTEAKSAADLFSTPWFKHEEETASVPETAPGTAPVAEPEPETEPEAEPEAEPETDPNQVLIPEFEIDHAAAPVSDTTTECEPIFPSSFEIEPEEDSYDASEPQETPPDSIENEPTVTSTDTSEPEPTAEFDEPLSSLSSFEPSVSEESTVTPDPSSKPDPTADFRSYLQQESTDDFRAFLTNSSTEDFRAFLNREADARFHHSAGAGEAGFSTDVPPEA
jgi:hypothetical protein